MIECCIVTEPVDLEDLHSRVTRPSTGATLIFSGTVRQSSGAEERSGRVIRLEYEAYREMAESQMLTIADEALVKHHLERVIVHHRIGKLEIGDIAVGIACSAAHRPEAFAGCRYIIEELKNRVPIWKKEVFADGAEWVDPRP